jgi:hypothetical protein
MIAFIEKVKLILKIFNSEKTIKTAIIWTNWNFIENFSIEILQSEKKMVLQVKQKEKIV